MTLILTKSEKHIMKEKNGQGIAQRESLGDKGGNLGHCNCEVHNAEEKAKGIAQLSTAKVYTSPYYPIIMSSLLFKEGWSKLAQWASVTNKVE